MQQHLKQLMMTLALLVTAAAGAWAEGVLNLVVNGTSGTLKFGSDFTADDPYLDIEDGWRGGGSYYWENMGDLTAVTIDGSCKNFSGTSLNGLFVSFSGLTTINGLENLNTANVQNMEYMFARCSSLTSLDLSSVNTASVTTMFNMFEGCSKLPNWNGTVTHAMAKLADDGGYLKKEGALELTWDEQAGTWKLARATTHLPTTRRHW